MPGTTGRARSVGEVLELYLRWGADGYDEDVSQLDHALQTARLAAKAGAGAPLVVAALLHDVGHLLHLQDGLGVDTGLDHEHRGARFLAGLFGPDVTNPVALHVRAKRYLCTVDSNYRASLSTGSEHSLQRQGGLLNPAEVAAFERLPGARVAVELRRWDDAGKEREHAPATLDDLECYRGLLERLVVVQAHDPP